VGFRLTKLRSWKKKQQKRAFKTAIIVIFASEESQLTFFNSPNLCVGRKLFGRQSYFFGEGIALFDDKMGRKMALKPLSGLTKG
jgi:hypothetical protein